MKILYVMQWWQPEPALKGMPFAIELMKLGHEVQVLTGFPNYPGGKVYDGYKVKFFQKEIMDNASILRVPLYPSHDRSSIRRIANYASFALSAATIGPWVVKKADVAYVYNTPSTVCFPACVIRLLRGIPLVYDIQDLWPETLQATGMFNSKFGNWLVDKYCRLVYKAASKIVVLSPGFKKILQKRGVPKEKIEVIYNWADASVDKPVEEDQALGRKLGMSGRFNIVFAGNMGKVQGLHTVLKAAKIVQLKCPKIQFVLVGGGVEVENLRRQKEGMKLDNVLFVPRQPISEIGKIMCLADVLMVHLMDDPLFRITIPSKIQTYLAIGKPILVGVCGDSADLVEKAQAGLHCEPENPASIAEAIIKLYEMPAKQRNQLGKNGQCFYRKNLALPIAVKRFEAIFKSVIKK